MSKRTQTLRRGALTWEITEDESKYWLDVLIQDMVVMEIEYGEWSDPEFEAEVLTCLEMIVKEAGLTINFDPRFVKDGIGRFIL